MGLGIDLRDLQASLNLESGLLNTGRIFHPVYDDETGVTRKQGISDHRS